MKEAGRLLKETCSREDLEVPNFSIRHLRNILNLVQKSRGKCREIATKWLKNGIKKFF